MMAEGRKTSLFGKIFTLLVKYDKINKTNLEVLR